MKRSAHRALWGVLKSTLAEFKIIPEGSPSKQPVTPLTGKQVPVGLVVLLIRFRAGAATQQGTGGLMR